MNQIVEVDGQRFARGERRDLFVMTKLADPTGTDAGWILAADLLGQTRTPATFTSDSETGT